MQIKTFRVPFAEIVGPEATELDFGPDDFTVVRPLFSRSASDIRDLMDRVDKFDEDTPPDEADGLVLDLMHSIFTEWHLVGPEGTAIELPRTPEALNALPGVLKGALFPFMTTYRGKGPNPTTRT